MTPEERTLKFYNTKTKEEECMVQFTKDGYKRYASGERIIKWEDIEAVLDTKGILKAEY